ncbi:MAG: glycyl-radical enzyme activating protein [Bacteroidetes bacterium]|nr:glycyl-radical enzyme activating protein [Bacteroidota bacterium]
MGPVKLTEAILFDIQGFSVHDGPGCRTLLFLKGCSLQCSWCSNPEGLLPFPEPLYNSSKCIFDNLCTGACPRDAITPGDQTLCFDREKCHDCTTYECSKACCTGALKIGGYRISEEELMRKIRRDRQYWGSNGGITLTGGEPFLQPSVVSSFLKKCHLAFIHTAVETCGNISWKNIEPSLAYLDWIFFDLKQMDDVRHIAMTGASNKLILENARKLATAFPGRLVFRMPVIPGFNDDGEHIVQLCAFLNSIKKDEINILPVHHLGREKYNLIGRSYYTDNFTPPEKESLAHIQSVFTSHGIRCYVGTDTPF